MPLFVVKLLTLISFAPVSFYGAQNVDNTESQEEKSEEEDSNLESYLTYGGVSLLAVGGAGSLIVAQNNKKKKDEPSGEIKVEKEE